MCVCGGGVGGGYVGVQPTHQAGPDDVERSINVHRVGILEG